MKTILVLLIQVFGYCTICWPQDYEKEINELERYVEQARKQWEVPGLAVAIVKNGKPIWSKGFGVRSITNDSPVNTETLFGICSTTKAMTAACMSMLVDEGLINWDDKVYEILPEFQLFDPFMTREIRVRDLFTHNTGLGNADLLWYLWDYQPEVIIAKMKEQQPAYPLRGGYTYQNNMYVVAGQIIEKISGKPWEIFIEERLFNPLNMKHSFATQSLSHAYTNRSIPHTRFAEKISTFPDESADHIAPAGSVWSTIEDMQTWMLFVLDSGKIQGERLISKKNYEEWFRPQTIVSDAGFYPTMQLTKPHWKTYALGWFQHDYMGRAVNFHTGSLQGTIAIIGLIPDEKLGVYVLGNLDHAEVRHAIMYKVFDVFSNDDPHRDWSTEFLNLYKGLQANRPSDQVTSVEIPPGFSLMEFAGIYEDHYLGKLEISLKNHELLVHIGPKNKAILVPKNRNTFAIKYISRPYLSQGIIQFNDNGKNITSLEYFNRTFFKKN